MWWGAENGVVNEIEINWFGKCSEGHLVMMMLMIVMMLMKYASHWFVDGLGGIERV